MMASLIGLSRGEYSCCCYGRWLDLQASGYKTNFSSNNGNKLYLENSYDKKNDLITHTLPSFSQRPGHLKHALASSQGPVFQSHLSGPDIFTQIIRVCLVQTLKTGLMLL